MWDEVIYYTIHCLLNDRRCRHSAHYRNQDTKRFRNLQNRFRNLFLQGICSDIIVCFYTNTQFYLRISRFSSGSIFACERTKSAILLFTRARDSSYLTLMLCLINLNYQKVILSYEIVLYNMAPFILKRDFILSVQFR